MSLAALRAKVSASPLAAAMANVANPESKTKNFHDDRFWKLTRQKDGNGAALIRFLPVSKVDFELNDNSLPYIVIYDHNFPVLNGKLCSPKTPGAKWYIEKSLSTFGEQDIVGIENSKLWNTGDEALKKIASARKRRTSFYSNILVLNDPANPENNGKIFLFKYGKQIFELINEQMNPPEDPLALTPAVGYNPFDFWDGANFELKIRDKDDYPSYDKSKFQKPSELFNGDEAKLDSIWETEYSLQELLDRKHFKTATELEARYKLVYTVGAEVGTAETNSNVEEDVPNFDSEGNMFEDKSAPKAKPNERTKAKAAPAPTETYNLDDDDDDLKFFESLAGG